ncbi:MAG TPA: AAA domain-containing protein [Trebonia sp.]|nr:AAA domain-containing protein [Trebonia sp.]
MSEPSQRPEPTQPVSAGPGDDSPVDESPIDESDARRLALVAAAQRQWTDALTDLGGRNTLLYYKDRRAGTLDLANADPDAVERFEKSGHIRLSKLFADADIRAEAIRRMQAIYRKARELQEERGIKAGYLATGLARWDELFLEPAAPVLLRPLTIAPTRARYDDFDLTLDDDTEVNPVLLHKLGTVFGAVIDRPAPDRIAGQLAKAARDAEIPGFRIDKRKVIGTFTYAKLPMVRDLEAAGDLLADSDLVAAIAGDPQAQHAVAPDAPPYSGIGDAELTAAELAGPALAGLTDPVADYSILDADSSQRAAIDAVLAGRSLVIHGPPGTGKSQTIANLIAAMVARGRKVLFVAEKRAAIDAVLSRLSVAGLADLVLDIHEGARDRQRIAAGLGATLDQAVRAADPDTSALHRRLTDRQRRLARHTAALHRAHEPWRLSAYQVQSALLGVPDSARVATRLAVPERITLELAEQLRDELREFTRLGGFEAHPGTTPWFGAPLRSREEARAAIDLAVLLNTRTLPEAIARLAAACQELGLPAGDLLSSHRERVRLTELFARTHDAEQGKHSFLDRRTLRRQVRAEWQALPGVAPDSEPRLPREYPALMLSWHECDRQLAELARLAPLSGLDADPDSAVAALAADQETPWRLPRLYKLARRFADLGLGPLLDEIAPLASEQSAAERSAAEQSPAADPVAGGSGVADGPDAAAGDAAPDLVAAAFDWAWYRAILDDIRVADPDYAAEGGGALDELADDFRRYDAEHLGANRARVRGAWARRLRETVDQHPLQARVIRKQAALRRGHLPLRRLLDQAGDVLFALKPCWAMSPLMVSQVLPLARLFDLVIFDEASQVVPADAIGSMIRAHQVVVAGDDRQLPPTSFFHQIDPGDPGDDDDPDEGLVSLRAGFESVLDALRPLLPTCPLTWHYRSRDERLVAFSNERIYGGALTTFPGVARDDVLRHVVVGEGGDGTSDEVTEVVRLIVEHARTRPGESLGVIALGVKHAERIDTALRDALTAATAAPASSSGLLASAVARELEAFFAETGSAEAGPEPFFVKNLERVQGDERDAIIISVGYGKHPDGRMRYQWGPLLRDGGERRLNVAATRARRRLTVVSSFSSHDVDPSRLSAPGARLLAEYLEYARAGGVPVAAAGYSGTSYSGEGGQPQGSAGGQGADVAFQEDVAARLGELGITVVPQYGVGGYRVDFAASHPDDASRMILAIEADGAGYRDSGSVRDRDRLRKEHLERLGWRVHRLWSTAWFTDPEGELAKLRKAFDSAVRAAPPPPAPEPETETPVPSATRPEPESEPEPPSSASSPQRPRSPEPGQHDEEPWRQDEESWPQTADPVRVVRAIPLGPGQRQQLSGPVPRALPASAATGGPVALPVVPDSQDR